MVHDMLARYCDIVDQNLNVCHKRNSFRNLDVGSKVVYLLLVAIRQSPKAFFACRFFTLRSMCSVFKIVLTT